jgi:hypothetical protein
VKDMNEKIAEKETREPLKTLSYTIEAHNDMIILRINHQTDSQKVPVEIKSCQRFDATQKRSGCFALEEKEHEKLVEKQGLYLFIVHDFNCVHRMWFMPAEKVVFRPRPTWTKVWHQHNETTSQLSSSLQSLREKRGWR